MTDRLRLALMTARGSVRAQTSEDATTATLQIRGPIEGEGWFSDGSFTDRVFAEQLAALPASVKTLIVEINSLGGDMAAGAAMANALIDQAAQGRETIARIVGIAASSASLVVMGAQRIEMYQASLLMIHEPWVFTIGNAADHRKNADVLDKFRDGLAVSLYKRHAKNLTDADLVALMAAETWLTADEAVERGLATAVLAGEQVEASLDRAVVDAFDVPKRLRNRVAALVVNAPEPAGASRVLAECRKAGCLELAEGLIEARATLEQVEARLGDATRVRAEEETRRVSIEYACKAARLPLLAASYVAGNMPLDQVRAQLLVIMALVDGKVEVDSALPPDSRSGRKSGMTTRDVYDIYNKRNSGAGAAQ